MTDSDLGGLKQFDSIEFNRRAEKAFLELCVSLIAEQERLGDRLSVRTLLSEAAFELDVSVETVKRYLLKHSARRGLLKIESRFVTLRSPRK